MNIYDVEIEFSPLVIEDIEANSKEEAIEIAMSMALDRAQVEEATPYLIKERRYFIQ